MDRRASLRSSVCSVGRSVVARPVVRLRVVVWPMYHRSNVGPMHPGRPVVRPDSSSILLLSYAAKQARYASCTVCDIGEHADSRDALRAGSDALGLLNATPGTPSGGRNRLHSGNFTAAAAARLSGVFCGPAGPGCWTRIDPAASGLHAHANFGSGQTRQCNAWESEQTCVWQSTQEEAWTHM